jgi:tetratricopeptide (TPR) repeat protein
MADTYVTIPDNPAQFMQVENAHYAIAKLATHAPVTWDDYLAISSAFFVLGNTPLAQLNAREAIRIQRNPLTLINLAVILESQSEFHTAFPLAEEAYQRDPSNNFAAILYSDALLRMGNYAEAWPIYSRSHTNWGWVKEIIPEWDGRADLLNKRILVLSGGGFGDNFFHLRWIPNLKARGAQITYACHQSMHSLLEGRYGFDHLLSTGSPWRPSEYDYHTCILSLGGYFSHTTEPYLKAHPFLKDGRKQIGFRASAGEEKVPRRNRSLNSVQIKQINAAIYPTWQVWLEYPQPENQSWDETAGAIASCDLVITVDTAVAHLAGAMGIPCWVILPGNSAAYYGVTGDKCVWYPSHRLFRNHGEGIDHSVDSVCAALKELA